MSALLLEPNPIQDVYADGIAYVENLGTCFRVAYFTWAQCGTRTEKLVTAKIIRPTTSISTNCALAKMLALAPVLGEPEMKRIAGHH